MCIRDSLLVARLLDLVRHLARQLGRPVMDHAMDPVLMRDGIVRDSPLARRLALPVVIPEAGVAAVQRDIALARDGDRCVRCGGTLQATRGISVKQYLDPIIDIGGVGPPYIGPALAPGTDIWGVRRAPVSYGPASYDEIAYYPLADAMSVDDLRAYPWPSPDWFDFAAPLPSSSGCVM